MSKLKIGDYVWANGKGSGTVVKIEERGDVWTAVRIDFGSEHHCKSCQCKRLEWADIRHVSKVRS